MLRLWAVLFVGVATVADLAAKPEYPAMGRDIFDPAVPAEKLIGDALVRAKANNKKVLLFFGANWCPWCRRLHAALSNDPGVRSRLEKNFILVYVDANPRNDKRRNAAVLASYGNPTREFGLPALVVLDRDGRMVTTQETASLAAESDAEVARRVLAFLEKWSGEDADR